MKETNKNKNTMKNFTSIINSNLNENERTCAEMLREVNADLKGKTVKAIKEVRTFLNEMNLTEKDLENACIFHNVTNEYCRS